MATGMETTDVLICGCGPTGAMLSAYLGRIGVANVVLEKEKSITTDPRGIALDEDGIRLLQGLGVYDDIFSDIGTCIPKLNFVSGIHTDLNVKPFLSFDTSSTAGNTAHVAAMSHKQPILEKHLRSSMRATPSSDLRSGCELTAISEDKDWVYIEYLDMSGTQRRLRSRFLVAADGKTGFVRKHYLEPKGIDLLWVEKTRYNETWVAMNWKITPPTPETHPTFPLWNLGYSPDEVYDLFFPAEFSFLCNPSRSAVCGRFGLRSDRLWRFEFVVKAGEDSAAMSTTAMVEEVVSPYFTHLGNRYGLSEPVAFPADCIEVLRCRPFQFSARSCNKWALGRVLLCGDAAHVFPPFGGQGIASGFRDAVSLSWRLSLALQPGFVDFGSLFAGWYLERKQQLEVSLVTTVRNGSMVNSRNQVGNFVRDWGLWVLQHIPSWKAWLEAGQRRDGPMKYEYHPGMAFLPTLGGGVAFSQACCISLRHPTEVETPTVYFSDDVIFSKSKTKVFQIVPLLSDMSEVESTKRELKELDLTSSHVDLEETTFFIPRSVGSSDANLQTSDLNIFRTASIKEFANSSLCSNRPYPRGYKEDGMWSCVKGMRFIILRLDRFVFAATTTSQELQQAIKSLSF